LLLYAQTIFVCPKSSLDLTLVIQNTNTVFAYHTTQSTLAHKSQS